MNHTVTPVPGERPANAIVHGACKQWWTGLGRAHCAACCRTFSTDSAADKHRVGTFGPDGDRHCADPATVGLVAREQPYGVLWGWPSSESYDLASRRAEEELAAAS